MRAFVVLPTYNEAGNIADAIRRIRAAMPAAHILVVDDGSPDGTAAIARHAGRELGSVDVIEREKKAGLGTAYRDGFAIGLERGAPVLVEMDADLSHDPADLPRLLAAIDEGADLVIGSRYVEGGSLPPWSWHRRLLSRWGNAYASRVLRLDVRDATSGYRAYRAELLEKIDLDRVRAGGYGFQIEMAYRSRRAGVTIAEVPISFRDRTLGTSKMSTRIIIEAFLLVTLWAARDFVQTRRRGAAGAPAR